MVLKNEIIETEKGPRFEWNRDTKQIETIEMSRTIKSTIHTKRNIEGIDTKPYGYEENNN